MSMSKRVLALVLALVLGLSLCVTAWANPAPPEGMPPGGMMGEPPGGMPPGGMMGEPPGGMPPGGPGGPGGPSISEADLPAAQAVVYGPYDSLTLTAVTYDPAYESYVDSARYAHVIGLTTDQLGEIVVDSSLYIPVLIENGVTLNPAVLTLPYAAGGEVYLVLTNKGMYTSQGNAKFGADAGSLIGDLYYTASAYVANGQYNPDRSILPRELVNGSVTDTQANDVILVSQGDYLGGFYIADSDYTINNANVTLTGKGGDDFTGIGSAVVAKGAANVTINNSIFSTAGVLRSAIWAGDSANVYVNDTVVVSENDFDFVAYNTDDNFATPMMQQVPFALGMTGNIRATLVCGQAKNWFKNSLVTSSGWAVLSTDSGSGGLDARNTTAVLGFAEPYDEANAGRYTGTTEVNGQRYGFIVGTSDQASPFYASGYIAYCDGFTDEIYGSSWYAPDYLAIITGGSLTFAGDDTARGYGYSDRIGFMSHQTRGASVTISNSDFEVADTFYMTKNKSGNYDVINLNDVILDLYGQDAWSGVIYQLMDSDDLGDGPGATSYTIPYYTYDQYLAGTGTPAGTTLLTVKDSDLVGDVYNSTAYYNGASSTGAIDLTLDNSCLTGVISSSYAYHVNTAGQAITGGDDQTFTVDCYTGTGTGGPDGETYDYLTIGRIVNTAAPTRGNPVAVKLQNGATWVVTGQSYVSSLTVDETSQVIGDITQLPEGGWLVTPTSGAAVVPAAPVAVVSNQSLQINGAQVSPAAYNIDGYNYFKIRDLALLLSGTDAAFDVGYLAEQNAVSITSGIAYTRQAGDLRPVGVPGYVVASPQSVLLDGEPISLTAYNIDGNNYYKLRDLGEALGFAVDYDEATRTMLIATPDGTPPEISPAGSIDLMAVSSYSTLDPDTSRPRDAGHIYVGYDVVNGYLNAAESNWAASDPANLQVSGAVEGPGFTALHASGAATNVNLSGELTLADDTQGYYASDFTGTGAAVVATDSASVFATGLDLTTRGFVRAAFLSYKGAKVVLDDCNIVTYGANPLTQAYEGYVNSANTSAMISPPWVLGIQGGIRTVNVLGDRASLIITNSRLASGGWGVLSTDGCSNPAFYVADSTLEVLPESQGGMDSGSALFSYAADAYGSGYGSYVIGNARENFYGVTINGATYAAIAREGTAVYQSSNGAIDLYSAQGDLVKTHNGAGQNSQINTVFGFLSHSGEDCQVEVLDGTVVNTAEAAFLYKSSGTATYLVDNAQLNSASGVLLQMIDDDDSSVGMGNMSNMGFNTSLNEAAGLPSVSGKVTGLDGNAQVVMTLTNGAYAGDLYNGTGYYGQGGDVLNLTIGQGAALTGDVALTQTIHGVPYSPAAIAALQALGSDVSYVLLDESFAITQDEARAAYIQLTSFSINQYYCLGHVLNSLYYNGNSAVNVTVKDGGVWTVEDTSLITCLTIEEGSTVYGALSENPDGSLTLTASGTALAAGVYGTEKQPDLSAASGDMAMSPGMMGGAMGGPPPGGPGGPPPDGFGGGPGGPPPDGFGGPPPAMP